MSVRIGFVLNQFPELSQTFVLRQVIDLLRRGHAVEVIAARSGAGAAYHDALRTTGDRYGLAQRTRYTSMPEGVLSRLPAAARLVVPAVLRFPQLVAVALNVRRFGWFAASGSLLTMAAPLAGERLRFDAIIAHFGPQGVLAQGLREMGILHGPLATFFHAYDLTVAPRLVGRGMYRRLFDCGELQIAISERGAEQLRALGAPHTRVRVHHMGVDISEFRPPVERTVRSTRGRAVISIGRLVAKKGFEDGLRAIARAKARGIDFDYSIYGAGPLGPALQRSIRHFGLSSSARLRGPASQERLADVLRSADVLLAPSVTSRAGDEEGIPIVLMEALATGVPVVATECGAVTELVRHGETGLVVRQGDVDGMAGALCRLSTSSELRERLAAAGRARVLADFNESQQGSRLVELLEGMRPQPRSADRRKDVTTEPAGSNSAGASR